MTKYLKPLKERLHACMLFCVYYSPRLHLCDTNDHLVTRVIVPYMLRPPPSLQNRTPDKTSQSRARTCGESDTKRGYVNEGSVSTCSQIKPEHRDRFRETVGAVIQTRRMICVSGLPSLSPVLMGVEESCALWQPLADLLSNFQHWMNSSGSQAVKAFSCLQLCM